MSTVQLIGIRREDKHHTERRVPLTPSAVSDLIRNHGLKFVVESSPSRVFLDQEYAEAGAEICTDLPDCDLVFGLKEIPLEKLLAGKPHLFFSHTIKGQPYNMPLLRRILDRRCTLIDYERVIDAKGMRTLFFGVHAGQAGMINTLWSFGQRLKALGVTTPFAELKQAREYDSLAQAKEAIAKVGQELRRYPLPKRLQPLTCAITGTGHVAKGAQEVFDLLEPIRISPSKFLQASRNRWLKPAAIYKVVFRIKDMMTPKDVNGRFHLQDYFDHPEKYRTQFTQYLPHFTLLLNGIYWDSSFPRLMTLQDTRALFENGTVPKLTVIGDVTCDLKGGIECTVRATTPDNPVYVYHPATGKDRDGFEGDGLQIMAVDILPTELPRDASTTFSNMLAPCIPALAEVDFSHPLDSLELPLEFQKAIVAHAGSLTPNYTYLSASLEREGPAADSNHASAA